MSDSPQSNPKDVEQGGQSPEEDAQMNDPQDPHASGLTYEFEVKEQDRWLPIANVARIMKNALPENAKIAKEAKECMQECVSEFISFITSEGECRPSSRDIGETSGAKLELTDRYFSASEKCHQEKRKTVNGEDILFAMTSLGFENYAEALKIYLSKYRESQSNRGENQPNRPNSQGYGAGGSAGGANPGASAFPGGDLTGQQPGASDDYMYATQGAHNGAGAGEGY